MDFDEYENLSDETETLFEAEKFESSEDPPMDDWSSLDVAIPEENQKKKLYSQGLYEPGSRQLCEKYISISQTSIRQHAFYNYPAVTDPGIKEALFLPEKRVRYAVDGQQLYLDTCQKMGQVPVRSFHRNLLNKVIDLTYYCVDPKGVRAMALALVDNNNVQVLNFTGNFLDDDACYHLGKMLSQNAALVHLNMSRCRIKASGVQRLLKGIARNRSLKILNLNRNELGDNGAECVAKSIKDVFNVEELSLSYNHISARGTSALAEAFGASVPIVKLDLSWNNLVTPEPTYEMLVKLSESDALQEIDLSWNALAGLRIGTAVKLLLKAPNLRYLNLSNNALAGDAITELMKTIGKATNLITIDLSFNPLSLFDALTVLKKIKSVETRLKDLLMKDIRVNTEFVELQEEVRATKGILIFHGDVVSSYEVVAPDMRELVLKRAAYVARKSKMHRVDFTLLLLKLVNEKDKLITAKDFGQYIRAAGVHLDGDLLDTMVSVFIGPSTPKVKNVDLSLIADYILRLWPDKKLPPTAPTIEPEPGKLKQKLNKKQKRKKPKSKK